ncbi:MAG: GMP synthase [Ginsengibacter sp.]
MKLNALIYFSKISTFHHSINFSYFCMMNFNEKQTVRIAILDLYEGVENQGMRCLREIVNQYGDINHLNVILEVFDVRLNNELPDTSWDIYISTGGPGSPLESEGKEWDNLYINWIKTIENFNNNPENIQKKFIFLICHSFQIASRHYKIAKLSKRHSTSFGVFPIHLLEQGKVEPVFDGMADPFYAVDSRDYQVTEPDLNRMKELGAKILCIEKERPHIPFERAIMGVRFSDYCIGTQFHPEADAVGMSIHLQTPDKKQSVIENYGEKKWDSMIAQLNDPDKILWTYMHILPNFLNIAVGELLSVHAVAV